MSFILLTGKAQQTAPVDPSQPPPVLPNFSALIKTGKIQLDWLSGFANVREIGIQRSLDSVLNFYTIGYASSPAETRNAYLDNKPLPGSNYYRLFILLKNGRYFFSNVVLAIADSTIKATDKLTSPDIGPPPVAGGVQKAPQTNASRPPLANVTPKDEKPPVWKPSNYIYTTADGNVNIKLADAATKAYSIKFYEPNGTFLFDIPKVKDPFLILEKAIFLHAGWFAFELFENGNLKEKWTLFIPLNYKN
ncbi:hypothetical protein DCM91_02365 [Chitinophaga costaii]|nr:hypothetical protein DCM91_02365 [Chitinophaga costaii]